MCSADLNCFNVITNLLAMTKSNNYDACFLDGTVIDRVMAGRIPNGLLGIMAVRDGVLAVPTWDKLSVRLLQIHR